MQNQADLFKTRAFLRRAQGQAGGWDVQIQNEQAQDVQAVAEKGVALYLCEPSSSWTWCGFVALERWREQVSRPWPTGLSATETQACLGLELERSVRQDPQGLSEEAHQRLGVLAAAYAMTTRTLEQAQGLKAGGHFITLFYLPRRLLRPFASPVEGPFLPVQQFQAAVRQVHSIDRQRHPDWFV